MNTAISLMPHWIVGDQHIYNQLEAWQKILTTKQDFRFYFYETEYDQYDWTKEPTQSWESLIQSRCIQLRQKYKDLRLFYSAGRDSQHILNSFVRYNIAIDELVLMHYVLNPIRTREYYDWILPNAQQYLHHNPKARITTITVDERRYDQYYNEAWLDDSFASGCLGIFQPTCFSWVIENLCDIKNSSTGFIVGLDKPKLFYDQGKIFTAILDKGVELFIGSDAMNYFYYAPEMPELHIKQVHMMINYLAKHYPNANEKFLHNFNDHGPYSFYDEMCISVGRGPALDINVDAQNGKNKYTGAHRVFKYIQSVAEQNRWSAFDHWQYGMAWFSEKYPEAFNTLDFSAGGTKGIYSKRYYICEWPKKFQISVHH